MSDRNHGGSGPHDRMGDGHRGGQGMPEEGAAASPSRSLALARQGLRTAGDVTDYMLATLEDEAIGTVTVRQLDKRAKGVIATAMMARACGPETVLSRAPRNLSGGQGDGKESRRRDC